MFNVWQLGVEEGFCFSGKSDSDLLVNSICKIDDSMGVLWGLTALLKLTINSEKTNNAILSFLPQKSFDWASIKMKCTNEFEDFNCFNDFMRETSRTVIIIPPATKLGGGILESPCPSVCPSVRLSVCPSVDARLGKMVQFA